MEYELKHGTPDKSKIWGSFHHYGVYSEADHRRPAYAKSRAEISPGSAIQDWAWHLAYSETFLAPRRLGKDGRKIKATLRITWMPF